MMWLARQKPLVAVAAALILATTGVVVQGRQQPAPEGSQAQAKPVPPPTVGSGAAALPDMAANRAIARKQLALIDEAEAFLRVLARAGRESFGNASFSLWGHRRLEALHRAGAGKAEIVAELKKYIDILKEDEAVNEELLQHSRGNRLGIYELQFRRMEAEIWLNEAKAR